MTTTEETYLHYIEGIDSLNRAWYILCELRAVEKPKAIHAAAFRFALIEYAKPYIRSDGKHRRGRNSYKLPAPNLAQDFLTLHHQILDLRDTFLAHNDLTLKEAKLFVIQHGTQPLVGVFSSNSDPSLPDREAVINLIERTLDQMYVEQERLEKNLRQTD